MAKHTLISYEDPWYIAKDSATGIVSQGKTTEEAKRNLQEALELYFEDTPIYQSETAKAPFAPMEARA